MSRLALAVGMVSLMDDTSSSEAVGIDACVEPVGGRLVAVKDACVLYR